MNNLQELLNKTLTAKQTISILSFIGAFVFITAFAFNTTAVQNSGVANVASAVNQAKDGYLSAANETGCSAGFAKSIEQYGITWFFQDCEKYGQFANGDYWIVGPATITRITPESSKTPYTLADGTTVDWIKNGTMINPKPMPSNAWKLKNGYGGNQGFDSSAETYASYSNSNNVAPSNTGTALVVPAHTSVVSSISTGVYKGRSVTDIMAILTVLPSPAPDGSFRPQMTGTDKTVRWNKSQLDYSILKKLAPVADTPLLSTVEGYFEKPWQVMWEANSVQAISPTGNMPNYGRDNAHQVTDAILSLHLNYTDAQKEKLYIRFVQYGIDIYGAIKDAEVINAQTKEKFPYDDIFYTANGGLNVGRKAPMVLAGLALNDSGIKDLSNGSKYKVFHEDKQTFYVPQALIDGDNSYVHPLYPDLSNQPYTQDMLGMPEWGPSDWETNILQAGSNWNRPYRVINGGPFVGNGLGVMLATNGESTWNWPAFFDYVDRYWSVEYNDYAKGDWRYQSNSWPNRISKFAWNMWLAYRDLAGPYTPPTPPTSATLTTTIEGSGTITGNSSPYDIGATATIVANPTNGSVFTGWSGACSGTNTTCTLTMSVSKSVTATFTQPPQPPQTLYSSPQILTLDGTQSQEIVVDDSKITNALTVSAYVKRETDVTTYPSVVSDEDYSGRKGYRLGDASTAANSPICFRVNGQTGETSQACESSAVLNSSSYTHYVAVFDGTNKKIRLYRDGTLVSEKSHPSSLILEDNGTEIIGNDLKGSIKDVQIFNYVLTPMQIPDIGIVVPSTNTLTTSVTGSGLITGTGIICGLGQTDCTETYTSGTSVSLLATPATNYSFAGWSGACTGTSNTCEVSMNEAKNVTANFTLIPPPQTPIITTPLNNTIFPPTTTNISVSWNGDATNYIVRYTTNNTNEVQVNITNKSYAVPITPGNTYQFYVAAGTETNKSTEANVNFSVEEVVSTYTLTVNKVGTGNGTINGNLIEYNDGDIAILTATPDANSTVIWSGCSGVSGNVCTVNMTSDITVIATFNAIPLNPPASRDRILSISGTRSVEIGKTYDVTVTYDAKSSRYITLDLKQPYSTVYSTQTVLVPQGKSQTYTFSLKIPEDTPINTKLEYFVYMSSNGSYNTKLSAKNYSSVYITGQNIIPTPEPNPIDPNLLYSSTQTYTQDGTQSVEIAVDDSKITNALTISAKVIRNSDVSTYPAIIADEDYLGNKGYQFGDLSSGTNGPICFRVNGSIGYKSEVCELSAVLNSSSYTHYVGVFDGVNKKIRLYRDGTLVSEKTHSSASISIDTGIEEIGLDFKGSIKEIQIFNKVLNGSLQ
jgi:uncharacterized repeat protein (TIGR02543 family)